MHAQKLQLTTLSLNFVPPLAFSIKRFMIHSNTNYSRSKQKICNPQI